MSSKINKRSLPAIEAYSLFRESKGTLSLEEINRALKPLGYSISGRTYRHLKSLLDSEAPEYLPINAYDQWKKAKLEREDFRAKRAKALEKYRSSGPRIKRLSIKNLRTLRKVAVELSVVNILIGPNGGGKSSVLEALALIGAVASRRVDESSIEERGIRSGGALSFLSRLKGAGESIEIEVTGDGDSGLKFLVVLVDDLGEWRIAREKLEATGEPVLERCNAEVVSWLQDSPKPKTFHSNESVIASYLPETYANGHARGFLQNLERFRVFQGDSGVLRGQRTHDTMAHPVGLAGRDLELAFDDVLAELQANENTSLMREVSALLGWADEVLVIAAREFGPARGPVTQERMLAFRDRNLKPGDSLLSSMDAAEGALHLIFLVVLSLHPSAPPIIAVEHPDVAMHPRLTAEAMSFVIEKLISNPRNRQAFFTTHNPALLDALPEEAGVSLIGVDRTNRGDSMASIIDYRQIRADIEEVGVSLSELWMSGGIGAVPNL